MAKAKKTTTPKPSTNKPSAKKNPTPGTSIPGIDLAQSAASAAAMIAHKVTATSEDNKTQSASFRQLKDSLTKPHSQTIGGLLDKASALGQKKTGSPLGGPAQTRHNQTFGADVNRRSVPRRTSGG